VFARRLTWLRGEEWTRLQAEVGKKLRYEVRVHELVTVAIE
jgi:hypothetical protein